MYLFVKKYSDICILFHAKNHLSLHHFNKPIEWDFSVVLSNITLKYVF